MTAPRGRGEAGSALIIALVFLLVVGVTAPLLLGFATTTTRAGEGFTTEASLSYAADAGLQLAVAAVRNEVLATTLPGATSCPSGPPRAVPTVDGVSGLTVTCAVTAGTGATFPEWSPNVPPQAVMSTNSPAAHTVGTLLGTGAVDTVGLAGLPAVQTAPACGAGWLYTFSPGSYTNEAALDALTDTAADGACGGPRVLWFQPGTYYFDFTTTPSGQWILNDPNVTVVAGTPQGWSTTAGTIPALGGLSRLCGTDADTTPTTAAIPGVSWAFGGDSTMAVSAGRVEVCPSTSTMAQEIAGLGLTVGNPSASQTTTSWPKAQTGGTPAVWTNPTTGALALDGTVSSINVTNVYQPNPPPAPPAALQVSSFDTSAIPAGARIISAQLSIAHKDSGTLGALDLSATSSAFGASPVVQAFACAAGSVCDTTNSSQHTDTVDISPAVPSVAALAALTVALTPAPTAVAGGGDGGGNGNGGDAIVRPATFTLYDGPPSGTEAIDAVSLSVTWAPLSLRAENGCVVVALAAGGCGLLSTSGSANVAVRGTVVAPAAGVVLTTAQAGIFGRGLVAAAGQVAEAWLADVSVPAAGGEWDATFAVASGTTEQARATAAFPTTGPPVVGSWVPDT